MSDDLSVLRDPRYAAALGELDELMALSGRAFLLGAGCSKCAGLPLMAELTSQVLANSDLSSDTKAVLGDIKKAFAGSLSANIEDYLSELVDLLAISSRRKTCGAEAGGVSLGGRDYTADQLEEAVREVKSLIAEIIGVGVSMETHLAFIKAVHRPLRPGRPAVIRPVDYLVLNYDTLIESALALSKLRYCDGMSGGGTAWWDIETFESSALSARVMKLHGSIDWAELPGDPLPRRVDSRLNLRQRLDVGVLIWPASTKYRETQRDPYAQIAAIARHALSARAGLQSVLVICGYSFADAHINAEVERALRESRGDLTVVVFTYDEEPSGDLGRLYGDRDISDQLRIHARRGFFHGSQASVSSCDLPWWRFENIVRILGGER